MITPITLHYAAVFFAIGLSAIGSGIGQGIAGFGTLKALARQRTGFEQIFRSMVLGLALIESGLILALVIVLILLFGGTHSEMTWAIGYAELGMGISIGFAALGVGIASSLAVKSASVSIARQPHNGQKIITLMLLVQSIIEAPVIFALLIALLIKTQITASMPLHDGLKLCAAGVAIGIGSIGPSVGQAIFASAACSAIGLRAKSYTKLLPFSLVSQAVIETPLIFSLVISTLLIFKPLSGPMAFITSALSFVIAFVVGFGTGGASIASGYVASKSVKYVALDEKNYAMYLRTTLFSQAIIESSAIYSLIVGLLLVTKTL
jgi:F-type H+-transporting ATPase subunit c